MHALLLPIPSLGLNVPASQIAAVAFVEPSAQKWPLAHGPEQRASVRFCSPPNRPLGQRVGAVAPLEQKCPSGQALHSSSCVSPDAPLKRPTGHCEHASVRSEHDLRVRA